MAPTPRDADEDDLIGPVWNSVHGSSSRGGRASNALDLEGRDEPRALQYRVGFVSQHING